MNPFKPRRKPLVQVGVEAPSRTYFQGELMTCCLCGRQERSDPRVESQWRCIQADGVPYYACPAEFPPDGATREKYQAAYERVLARIMQLRTEGR